jgi:hypothetical protein
VARNSTEALQWLEQQRDKFSVNENALAQYASGLKP